MANVQSNNREQLTMVKETSFGSIAGSPAPTWQGVPFVSNSLSLNKALLDSAVLSPDRTERWSRHGNYDISGTISTELCYSNLNMLLLGALGSSGWSSHVITNGTTENSFQFERAFLGLDTPQYFVYKGCKVTAANFALTTEGVVTANFDIIGASETISTSSSAGSFTAIGNYKPFTHIGSTFSIGGSPVTHASTLNWAINGNAKMLRGIGSASGFAAPDGEFVVSGTSVLFFKDLSEYNIFKNESETTLSIQLTDGTNTLTFAFGKVKFNSAKIPNSGGSGQIMVTVDWQALSSSGVTVTITESA